MDKKHVVAGVVGLSLAVTVPRMAAPAPSVDLAHTDVVAAMDMFLDLGPVKGESRRPGVRPRKDR
jgi:hypothetical protein